MSSTVSKEVFDLIYDLLINKTWDPQTLRVHGWDHLIYGSKQTSKENLNKPNKLMVELPNNNYMCDRYIKDGIMFGLEQNAAQTRLTLAGPVVVDAIFCPTGKKLTVIDQKYCQPRS